MAGSCAGGNKTSGFHKMRGTARIAEDLSTSQERLSSLQMVSSNTLLSYASTADFIAAEVGIKWHAVRRVGVDIASARSRVLYTYLEIDYPDSMKFLVISLSPSKQMSECLQYAVTNPFRPSFQSQLYQHSRLSPRPMQ